jgi:ankyrin repeat protein
MREFFDQNYISKLKIIVSIILVLSIFNNCWGQDLISAASKGHINRVRKLLDKGENVDIRKKDTGETALIVAASKRDSKMAELLIEKGADVNAKSSNGTTALMWAIISGNVWFTNFFLDRGADANAADFYSQTPLYFALSITPFLSSRLDYGSVQSRIEIAKSLIKHGAELPNKKALLICPYLTKIIITRVNNVDIITEREFKKLSRALPKDSLHKLVYSMYYNIENPNRLSTMGLCAVDPGENNLMLSLSLSYYNGTQPSPDILEAWGGPINTRFNAREGFVYIINYGIDTENINTFRSPKQGTWGVGITEVDLKSE